MRRRARGRQPDAAQPRRFMLRAIPLVATLSRRPEPKIGTTVNGTQVTRPRLKPNSLHDTREGSTE